MQRLIVSIGVVTLLLLGAIGASAYVVVRDRKNADLINNRINAAALATIDAALVRSEQRADKTDQTLAEILQESQLLSPADLGNRRLDIRLFMIRDQLSQADQPIVFIGDSITEAARLPSSICGHPVVNAGIGGASVASYPRIAAPVIDDIKASLVVIALGINDAALKHADEFPANYRALVSLTLQHAPNVVLVGISPIEEGTLKSYFDLEEAAELDRAIRTIAHDQGLAFADVRSSIKPGSTVDGVHLWAKGFNPWISTITAAIGKTLSCPQTASQ